MLYDHKIDYNISNLPDKLKELINKLEKFDIEGDWLNYDLVFDELEITAKGFYRNKIISDYDYKMILFKYGGLYD